MYMYTFTFLSLLRMLDIPCLCHQSKRVWYGGASGQWQRWCLVHSPPPTSCKLHALNVAHVVAPVCVCVHACVRACVRACMRACVRACMHVCVCVSTEQQCFSSLHFFICVPTCTTLGLSLACEQVDSASFWGGAYPEWHTHWVCHPVCQCSFLFQPNTSRHNTYMYT